MVIYQGEMEDGGGLGFLDTDGVHFHEKPKKRMEKDKKRRGQKIKRRIKLPVFRYQYHLLIILETDAPSLLL